MPRLRCGAGSVVRPRPEPRRAIGAGGGTARGFVYVFPRLDPETGTGPNLLVDATVLDDIPAQATPQAEADPPEEGHLAPTTPV
ncbi:hypothetical protein AIGOOFII_2795 [Methylobacterium marchantiae]|nr:hypothetical protein AIGOOFII_2795 [Methylobacterium marchantiae]